MLDAATEDAVERGSWIDSLSVLPTSFGSEDASKVLSLCPSVQLALKSSKALILGESYLFSDGFIKDLYDRLEKEMDACSVSGFSGALPSGDLQETKAVHDSSGSTEPKEVVNESGNNEQSIEKGSKKKRVKSSGSTLSSATESFVDCQENILSKSEKGQRKGKSTSSSQVSDPKATVKKESVKIKEDNLNIPSEEWVMQNISVLAPDFKEQGMDDPETIIRALSNYLRPMLNNAWKERKKAVFTENAERMKRLLDNLQKKLDESFLNLQLFEKALDLFEGNPTTSVILHRHLLRTTAMSIADMLLRNLDVHNKLKNGVQVEEPQDSISISLCSGERTSIAKSFSGSL